MLIVEKTTDFPSAEFSLVEDVALHFTCLMDRLNEQRLFQPDLCDVDIILVHQHSTFPAHKGVLAAYSPFFHSLFAQSKQLRRVDLSLDALTSQGLQQILNFIYTSKLLVSSSTVRDVLNAATLLQMSDIAASCRDLISSHSLRTTCRDMANQEDPAVVAMPPSQLYREIKQESDLGRVYTREGSSPFSVGVKELKEEGAVGVASMGVAASCKVEANGEKSKTASFNRNQIIVEVNLNNQTLNVSKGSEGSATVTESMFGRRHDEQDSEGDEDNDAENIGVGEEDVEVLKRTDLLGQSSEEEDEEEEEGDCEENEEEDSEGCLSDGEERDQDHLNADSRTGEKVFGTFEIKHPASPPDPALEELFSDVDPSYYDLDTVLTGTPKMGPYDLLESLSSHGPTALSSSSSCRSDLNELDHIMEIIVGS
uniref:Zinc finger and BTB domain containing 47 n=1 Tax=Nothobranchius furzeri TaxID=105023 RepID=A0A1A8AYV6_NOTFU